MSYITQAQDPRRRIAAIAGVIAIHAALGAGVVLGLTVSGVIPEEDAWNPFTLTPEPLPEPPPPAPQPRQDPAESFVTVPTPPLRPLVDNPVELDTRDPIVQPGPLVVDPGPAIVPAIEPARPLAMVTPRRARPSNDPLRWITTNDYPARALRAEAEGVAGYRLIVATSGRVSACEVTRSTGNGQLDQATCDFIARRARFEAATDESGAKVVGEFTGSVKWDIPE